MSNINRKRCIDVGFGGGRASVAQARLGASEVVRCDISEHGLEAARCRAQGLLNVRFQQASVLELPFQNEAFDLSGVVQSCTILPIRIVVLRK